MRYKLDASGYLEQAEISHKPTVRFRFGRFPLTLEDAKRFISGGRNKRSRTISGNTVLEITDDGNVKCTYYNTVLFHYEPDGVVFDYEGGYNTPSTRNRLVAPIRPYNVWYLSGETPLWGMLVNWQDSNRISRVPLAAGTKVFHDGSVESVENYPEHHNYTVITEIVNMVTVSSVKKRGWKRALETASKAAQGLERVFEFAEVEGEDIKYLLTLAQWTSPDSVKRVTLLY